MKRRRFHRRHPSRPHGPQDDARILSFDPKIEWKLNYTIEPKKSECEYLLVPVSLSAFDKLLLGEESVSIRVPNGETFWGAGSFPLDGAVAVVADGAPEEVVARIAI